MKRRVLISTLCLLLVASSRSIAIPGEPNGAAGGPRLELTVLLQGLGTGSVTDIAFGDLDPAPGPELGVAGPDGAILLQPTGSVSTVTFGESRPAGFDDPSTWDRLTPSSVKIVDLDGDGVSEYLDLTLGQAFWDASFRVWDHQGHLVKSLPAKAPGPGGWRLDYGSGVLAHLDADDRPDVVFGCPLTCGLQRLDLASGKSLWKVDGKVDRFFLKDFDGDGLDEILAIFRGGRLALLDGTGEATSTTRIPAVEKASHWISVARWPPVTGPYRLLVPERKRGRIRVLDLQGGEAARLDAPGLENSIDAVSARFGEGPEAYLVVTSSSGVRNGSRCTVRVYDTQATRVFEGTIAGWCTAMKAIPSGPGGRERVLIGGEDAVWQLAPAAGNRRGHACASSPSVPPLPLQDSRDCMLGGPGDPYLRWDFEQPLNGWCPRQHGAGEACTARCRPKAPLLNPRISGPERDADPLRRPRLSQDRRPSSASHSSPSRGML